MTSKNLADSANQGAHKFRLAENVRGALIVVVGAAALVGLAWGVMMMLTSPDGWVMKAANSAVAAESAQLISVAEENAQ